MKIHWMSNAPWARTGYGNQSALFVPRLQKAGHQMSFTAFYGLEGGILNIGGIPVYPRGNHAYGADVWSANAMHAGAEIVISLMDAWVFNPATNMNHMLWAPWFPIDMTPLPPPVERNVKQAFKRIVFSKFGERMVNSAGLDAYYVPHGIDTSIMYPMDMVECRKSIGLPEDRFIIGMVAANKGNPSRKALCEQIQAFRDLQKKHSDAFLYLHMMKGIANEGVNLPEFLNYLELVEGKDYAFCDQYHNLLGFPEEYMRQAYNSFDVLSSVSMGEGFGIPIVEAQACGCPVIVGDWTSMSELCFSGWKVREGQVYWTPLAAYQIIPDIGAIVEAYGAAYNMRGNQDYRSRARNGALAYDADKVLEKYWLPVLADIEKQLPGR